MEKEKKAHEISPILHQSSKTIPLLFLRRNVDRFEEVLQPVSAYVVGRL